MVALAGTKRLAFGGGQAASIAYRVVYGQPDLAGLSGPLAELVTRALAKDHDERPSAWGAAVPAHRRGARRRPGRGRRAALRWSPELLLARVGRVPGPARGPGSAAAAAGHDRGRLAGLLVLGGVAGHDRGRGPGRRHRPLQPPPTRQGAALDPGSAGAGRRPPCSNRRSPSAGRPAGAAGRPAPGLPDARLFLFDDFSARGNGWPEGCGRRANSSSSLAYADGAYRLIGDDAEGPRPPSGRLPELVRIWVDVDVAWAGHPRGRMTVDCPGSADVVLARDGSYRIEDTNPDPDARPLKTGKGARIDADGWTRLGIGGVTKGKRTTVTIVVDGDEALSFTGPNPEPTLPTRVRDRVARRDRVVGPPLLDNLAVWGDES